MLLLLVTFFIVFTQLKCLNCSLQLIITTKPTTDKQSSWSQGWRNRKQFPLRDLREEIYTFSHAKKSICKIEAVPDCLCKNKIVLNASPQLYLVIWFAILLADILSYISWLSGIHFFHPSKWKILYLVTVKLRNMNNNE